MCEFVCFSFARTRVSLSYFFSFLLPYFFFRLRVLYGEECASRRFLVPRCDSFAKKLRSPSPLWLNCSNPGHTQVCTLVNAPTYGFYSFAIFRMPTYYSPSLLPFFCFAFSENFCAATPVTVGDISHRPLFPQNVPKPQRWIAKMLKHEWKWNFFLVGVSRWKLKKKWFDADLFTDNILFVCPWEYKAPTIVVE